MTAALDWDDTLVDVHTKEWLPGAEIALRELLAQGHRVVIHTCRANWPEGLAEIEAKLAAAHIGGPNLTIVGKPSADVYVDNQALRFTGWATNRLELHQLLAERKAAA